jgi:hypothetical protein
VPEIVPFSKEMEKIVFTFKNVHMTFVNDHPMELFFPRVYRGGKEALMRTGNLLHSLHSFRRTG